MPPERCQTKNFDSAVVVREYRTWVPQVMPQNRRGEPLVLGSSLMVQTREKHSCQAGCYLHSDQNHHGSVLELRWLVPQMMVPQE